MLGVFIYPMHKWSLTPKSNYECCAIEKTPDHAVSVKDTKDLIILDDIIIKLNSGPTPSLQHLIQVVQLSGVVKG